MPMFKALKLCPEAVVVPPDMAPTSRSARQVRACMHLTPLVEPLSLDEAFLDLSGTERLHHAARRLLARLQPDRARARPDRLGRPQPQQVPGQDRLRPRQAPRLQLIGRAETDAFLARQPVCVIWGVGQAAAGALEAEGIRTIADLQRADEIDLMKQFGAEGRRLWRLARGIDDRRVVARTRRQDHFQRDHVRRPTSATLQRWKRCCGGCREKRVARA